MRTSSIFGVILMAFAAGTGVSMSERVWADSCAHECLGNRTECRHDCAFWPPSGQPICWAGCDADYAECMSNC